MYPSPAYAEKVPVRPAAEPNPLRDTFRARLAVLMKEDGAKMTARMFVRAASSETIEAREYGRWMLDRTSVALTHAAVRLVSATQDGGEIEIYRCKTRRELSDWIFARLDNKRGSRKSADLLERIAICTHHLDLNAPYLTVSGQVPDGGKILMSTCAQAWALFARGANREREAEVASWPMHRRHLAAIFMRGELPPDWGWRDALARIGQRFF
jgi:hypothetical protein